ncbi:DeoR family transcriptional regulator [Caulobacter sp. UNC358MFTsu5.1]|uniref:DeoR family transcriptional regulator n=1 Tax=Caulobacter sp. UNC358MFTsu5.1 TaxID=1449049 RepID=UPI00054D3DF5|nr:DeoR family transcriptional regulator [Caulobacter sp. UNC358MFTsu5.1]
MSTASPTSAPAGAAQDLQPWEVARASLGYIRDIVRITRGDRHFLDALIFTVALDANMTPVTRDRSLLAAYGGAEVSTPDELRRPVSINAVATSLRLPLETVRRRFLNMSRDGLCMIGQQGVIIPRAAVTSAVYLAEQRARFDRTRGFYQAMQAGGALPDRAAREASPATGEPLVRAANWAVSEYALRICGELVALTGNVVSSIVLLDLVLANIDQLPPSALPDWGRDPERFGRPVRIGALAGPLRVSGETIRRHLLTLETLGFCRRRSGGLVAVAPDSARPQLMRIVETNRTNSARLFARLGQLGVLDGWDAAIA